VVIHLTVYLLSLCTSGGGFTTVKFLIGRTVIFQEADGIGGHPEHLIDRFEGQYDSSAFKIESGKVPDFISAYYGWSMGGLVPEPRVQVCAAFFYKQWPSDGPGGARRTNVPTVDTRTSHFAALNTGF
jgi:hypothetical protein